MDSSRALRGSIQQGLWLGLYLRLGQTDGSRREMKGLGGEPQGKDKGTGQMQPWTTASSGRALAMPTVNKAIHAAQRPWPLQGPCLSRAQRNQSQSTRPVPQKLVDVGLGQQGDQTILSLVAILTAGVARNPIHPAAAAPAGVSWALGDERREERRSGQRREQCPPRPQAPHHTHEVHSPTMGLGLGTFC